MTALLGSDSKRHRRLEVKILSRAARFAMRSDWCALWAAQGPGTKVGGGPKGHAGTLALSTPPGLHKRASHCGVAGTEVPPRQKLSAPHWATGCLIKP